MKKIIFSALLLIYGFGSVQAQITLFPWTEGFESTTFPPAGWTILNVSGTKTWIVNTISTYVHSGTKSAEHGWLSGSVQATALITPAITLPNTGVPELDFWSRIQLIGYNNSSKVLISTTVNNTLSAFTEVKTLSGDEVTIAQWRNIVIPLDAYVGETIYIAFLYTADNGPYWYVDDVTISHFDSYVDIQAINITPITGEYAMLSTTEQVTVLLKNNGGAPASGFPVKLLHNDNLIATETFTGSIPSLGESTHIFNATLDLSATGTHKIQATAEMPGDQVPANNTATAMVTNLGCQIVTTFPYTEGFEDNGSNLPSCWTQEYVAKNFKWRVFNAASAQVIPGLEPTEAFEGNYKAVFYTNGKDGAITKLITPPMDLTLMNNPVLKFHHVQQHYAGDQDSLKVYYRTSAHGAWKLLEKYTEMVADWTERTITLPEPSSQYYIAFEGYAEYGHSVQLDKIFVGHLFDTDIAVKAISPAGVHLGLSEQQEITATIQNNGRTPVNGFNLSLYINDNLIATETYSGILQAVSEIDYIFNEKANISISGKYKITVVVDFPGDEVPENDELTIVVKNLVGDALTFPYDEGFEEDIFPPHYWAKVGDWQRLTYGAHSGLGRASYAWWYGTLGWLITPKFSIPAGDNFVMEFWSYCYEAKFYTYSGVWISTTNNNPDSFTEIHELNYNECSEGEWVRVEIPLSDYAGKDIYIGFKYRNNGGQSGHMWSVDDFNIYSLNTHIDAELVAITTPLSGMNLTDAETVKVKLKNNGSHNITNFPLMLELDGALLATETFTGFIPTKQETVYTFLQKADLSEADRTYTITATVNVAEDEDADNNSKTTTVTHFPNGVAVSEINPLYIWLEGDRMYIGGLNVGDNWSVYSIIGQLAYQGVAHHETVSFKPKVRGVYMIQSGGRVMKAVY